MPLRSPNWSEQVKINNMDVFVAGAAWRQFVMVKLTTDAGLVGWGEGSLGWKESAVRELITDFGRRYVIGRNPFDIEDLWFKLYQIEHNTGPVMYAAMAGSRNRDVGPCRKGDRTPGL
jgi:L-alanine-DL-glutamate epimerase-like enolase superfamily enzyme